MVLHILTFSLSHLTNPDMNYIITYASVSLLHSLCQLLSCLQHFKPSIIIYCWLEGILFINILLTLIVLSLLQLYEFFGQCHSHWGCSACIQMHCEYACALKMNALSYKFPNIFQISLYSCFLLGMYFRVVKLYCIYIRQILYYPTENERQAAYTKMATNTAPESGR